MDKGTLIITAITTLLGQGLQLINLWSSVGDDTVTKEQIEAEIASIMAWEGSTNAAENQAHQDALARHKQGTEG